MADSLTVNENINVNNEILNISENNNENNAVTETSTTIADADKALTRSQLKKKLKLEKIYKNRIEKRKKEREAKKLKRLIKKQNIENGEELAGITRNKLKKNLMANSKNKLRIVVDCSFESYMSDNDISHLCKQLQFCYAANRRMEFPLQFYITDYKLKIKDILDNMGGQSWDVYRESNSYLTTFSDEIAKGNVCYLTSDSPNVLETFDEEKVYIIGGLVDHNHHKTLCYNLALNNNIQHAQLPIGKYMNMKARQVLTVNQVFELICNYNQCNDWEKSFIQSLPKRKGAELRKTIINDDNSENSKITDDKSVSNEEINKTDSSCSIENK